MQQRQRLPAAGDGANQGDRRALPGAGGGRWRVYHQAAIEGMEELAIEFYGSLTEPEVRQAAAMKAAGIDPAFAPSAFRFQAGSNSLECPAGKQLGYVRQSSKRGQTYHQY